MLYSHWEGRSGGCNQKMEGNYHKVQRGVHRQLLDRTLLQAGVNQKTLRLIKLEGTHSAAAWEGGMEGKCSVKVMKFRAKETAAPKHTCTETLNKFV